MPTNKDVQTNLRKIRKSKGLSLRQVEVLSNGKYKLVTIGSYERGSRSITVSKLIELSKFYDVPITEFFGSRKE
jgi:transcriptional regulator with XRE-family HTH domain